VSVAQEPLGAGTLIDGDGLAVVTHLKQWDHLVIARLQDVDDHPDLMLDEAA
jgi:hypothetical protein